MKKRALFKPLVFPLFALTLLWAAGLVWFAAQLPEPDDFYDSVTHTDAIVALTGGSSRVEEALALLRKDLAPTLFVTGVGKDVKVRELFVGIEPELSERIVLGFSATNTRQNAQETEEWIQKNSITSIRLVTASYHMPRSLLEFRRRLPGIRIIPHPVFPDGFYASGWWAHRGSAALVLTEYHKLLASTMLAWFQQVEAETPEAKTP